MQYCAQFACCIVEIVTRTAQREIVVRIDPGGKFNVAGSFATCITRVSDPCSVVVHERCKHGIGQDVRHCLGNRGTIWQVDNEV